jgi:hypothetical protein
MVSFKIGNYAAYPKRKKFEYHKVASSQLKEYLGQSSIPVAPLAPEYADQRGHGGHRSTVK